MKQMSYRDKMILLIIAVLIIIFGGFFALFRPKYNAYKEDKLVYDATKTEWDGIDTKLKAIDPLKASIKQTRDKAAETAEIFVNDLFASANDTYENKKVTYQLDQYFQTVLDESGMEVGDLSFDEIKSEAITYNYYTPDVITYSLLEAGDINGNYAKDVAEIMRESFVLSASEQVELMVERINIEAFGNKEGLNKFLETIAANEEAVRVSYIKVDDYAFQDGLEVTGTDGQPVVIQEGEGTSPISLILTLYNAKPIDEYQD